MERADPEPGWIPVKQLADPLLHLPGGLVGERDRKNLVGRNSVSIDQRRDTRGEYAGLARARSCQHQKRAMNVLDRLPLCGIQRVFQPGLGVDHVMRAASGMRITKQVPPSVGSNISAPPCASSTTRRDKASPIPQPPRLVVVPGSNRVRRSSFGTPGPSSITRIAPMLSSALMRRIIAPDR